MASAAGAGGAETPVEIQVYDSADVERLARRRKDEQEVSAFLQLVTHDVIVRQSLWILILCFKCTRLLGGSRNMYVAIGKKKFTVLVW